MPASDLPVFDFLTRQAASGKPKLVGSRGRMDYNRFGWKVIEIQVCLKKLSSFVSPNKIQLNVKIDVFNFVSKQFSCLVGHPVFEREL